LRNVVGVNIRFTSTLTPEDENFVAPALLKALSSILDLLPIAYSLRIDTSDAQVFSHSVLSSPADLLDGVARADSRSHLPGPQGSHLSARTRPAAIGGSTPPADATVVDFKK
jgi:hypothetical protein